ncbi:MAG: GNAT family N-acetyltransferase [Armatimonadetes bacterium]|nr:GNAT family N-acetyltransferase [Armatimonadota bacterium]
MMTIRPAVTDDAESLRAIFASSIQELSKDHYDSVQIESWSEGFSVEQVRDMIGRGSTYVAESEGQAIGFVEINLVDREVSMVYVSPEYARRGVAKSLMRHAEAAARDAGIAEVHLRSSLNAVPFYERMGYRVVRTGIHCDAHGVTFECTMMERVLE